MKLKLLETAVLALLLLACQSQPKVKLQWVDYSILDQVLAPCTSVKNQAQSGTCWAFGGISLLESEILREQHRKTDLSEMWVVRHAYFEKVVKYVRSRGGCSFRQGGELQDVLSIIERYGIVPQTIYTGGVKDGQYDHATLDRAMQKLARQILKNKRYQEAGWMDEVERTLDAYLGVRPSEFEVDSAQFTPLSYAHFLGFARHKYVALTSFSHHPFYEQIVVETPDNWAAHRSLNVPLDTLMRCVDRALLAGYSVGWCADISERGFGKRSGLAVLLAADQRFELPVQEQEVTQASRQEDFDLQKTTDDHIMHLVGVASDSLGMRYYKVKNSWGQHTRHHGFWYVSPKYVAAKTIELLFPREALPQEFQR